MLITRIFRRVDFQLLEKNLLQQCKTIIIFKYDVNSLLRDLSEEETLYTHGNYEEIFAIDYTVISLSYNDDQNN
jgi:hypothetical protein